VAKKGIILKAANLALAAAANISVAAALWQRRRKTS
jgi:hypothetical protein